MCPISTRDDTLTPETRIFVSYASEDEKVASGVCRALEQAGFSCWLSSRDLDPGKDYADQILRAIQHSQTLVVILSPAAVDSPHVVREVDLSVSRRIPTLVMRLAEIELSGSLAYYLRTTHWLDAFEGEPSEHYGSLVWSLCGLLGLGRTRSAAEILASEDISELWRRLIQAHSRDGIRGVRYEIEQVRSRAPNDPQLRRLLDSAIEAERRMSSPAERRSSSPIGSGPQGSGTSGSGCLVFIILAVILAIVLALV
ncbi:MAG: TIR domain-containing protein [Candidatus Eisenbacteria bacterium]|nr:TIR domain-containing protein [Candidatus Eisenbacteria bacterium]